MFLISSRISQIDARLYHAFHTMSYIVVQTTLKCNLHLSALKYCESANKDKRAWSGIMLLPQTVAFKPWRRETMHQSENMSLEDDPKL